MRIHTNFGGLAKKIKRDLARHGERLQRATVVSMRESGRELKEQLRRQTAAGGLDPRLAKTWRDKAYPNEGLNAATLVWSKAPAIMKAAAEGPLIRPRRARFLVLPLPIAEVMGFNRGRKMTARGRRMAKFSDIAKAEKRFGKLRVIDHPSNSSWRLLVADNVVQVGGRLRKARSRKRKDGSRRYSEARGSVPLFELRPDVRWKQRIRPDRAARAVTARAVNLIDRHLERGR